MSGKLALGPLACAALAVFCAAATTNGCSDNSIPRPERGVSASSASDASTASSSSSSSGGTVELGPDMCGLMEPDAGNIMGSLIYNGGLANPTCPNNIDATGYPGNSWFSYNDGTSDSGTFVHTGAKGGCQGENDCAYHLSGSGYTGYGAGVGFTLNNNAPFDPVAKGFTGISMWIKGTATGTRTTNFVLAPNVVHIKMVTGYSDGSTTDPRNGDDYGFYCAIGPAAGDAGEAGASSSDVDAGAAWTHCFSKFSDLTRDGFRHPDGGVPESTDDMFDPQNFVKVQVELSAFSPSDGSTNVVDFDIWIDDISFF